MKNSIESILLSITEAGMLLYWIFAIMVATSMIEVSPALMYSNYNDPTIVSWNWSFLPIDLMFAVAGLLGRFYVRESYKKNLLSTISLSLMFCAGLMAISFWFLEAFYDPFWWAVNIWLIVLSTGALGRRLLYDQ